jgi:hypothetical protein
MAIQGVTVLCDFLRPDVQGCVGGVDRVAAWLYNAIRRQVALACGLSVRLLTVSTAPVLAHIVTSLRSPAEADEFWAAAFEDFSHGALEQQILPRLADQFCVVYEMPPYLARLLDRHEIPYLDIRVHPIRFLDDLLFAVRASRVVTRRLLADFAVAEATVAITAGLREAMCQFIGAGRIPANTLLVLGQRRFDSTQIVKGTFYDALDHDTAIAAILARYDAVVLKPHPLDPQHSLLAAASRLAGTHLGVAKDNVYRLLSLPDIAGVLSVSSSVAFEAVYFGKTVHTLAPSPIRLAWREDPIQPDQHVSIDDAVLSIDFWRAVLVSHVPVTPADGIRLPPKPNRLRLAMDSFWSFNQIDTDRLPRGP